MSFSSVVAVALGAVITATTPAASAPLNAPSAQVQQLPQAQTVEQYVDLYFKDEPIMIAIAGCESHFEQYDSVGQVLHNPNSSAVGVFQIMTSVHGSMADQELGIDINTLQGNVAYAQYLYQKQGTAPWSASHACWGKSVAAQNPKNLEPQGQLAVASK